MAKELPATVMSSHASSSTSKYLRAFRCWKEWANSHKLTSIPAAAHHIALYLQYIAKTTTSKATAEEAVYAIAWAHSLVGLPSPTEAPLVIRMNSELFLFWQITKSKKGEFLRDGGAVSYTTMRELFKKKVKELGYPADVFGLRSLLAGGASVAANAGVSDRLFKRHGR